MIYRNAVAFSTPYAIQDPISKPPAISSRRTPIRSPTEKIVRDAQKEGSGRGKRVVVKAGLSDSARGRNGDQD